MTAVVRVPFTKRLGFLYKARRLLIVLGSIYALLVALGTTSFAQGQYVFAHSKNFYFKALILFNWSCDTQTRLYAQSQDTIFCAI